MGWTHMRNLGLLGLLAVAMPAAAQVAAVTTPKHDLALAFTVPGRVATVPVKPGDRVKKDDVLIELDDRAGESQVEIYRLRATSSLAVEAADAELKVTEADERRIREAFEKSAAGKFEVEKAELQTSLARLRLAQAKEQQEQARLQLAAAEVAHNAFTLKAPIDGVIEEVVVSPGQTVEALKAVLRLVSADPLVIDAYVPTPETMTLASGAKAWILPRGDATSATSPAPEPALATIVHVAQVADARSDTRLVRIELPNPNGRPAGTHVSVYFTQPPRQHSSASAAPAAADR